MPALTYDQVSFLNSYGIFIENPDRPLFTLQNLHKDFFLKDFRNIMMGITNATTEAAAISHFSRRYGMFIATQFYFLTMYDEIWDGKLEDVRFSKIHEHGIDTLGTFITPINYRYVEDSEREYVITKLIYQCHTTFLQLRKTTSISPLVMWENLFGYLLWNFYELLENPTVSDKAFEDMEVLEDTKVWASFSNKSLFYEYTGGKSPVDLVGKSIRKSCCFSKDIPGLLRCELCPIK